MRAPVSLALLSLVELVAYTLAYEVRPCVRVRECLVVRVEVMSAVRTSCGAYIVTRVKAENLLQFARFIYIYLCTFRAASPSPSASFWLHSESRRDRRCQIPSRAVPCPAIQTPDGSPPRRARTQAPPARRASGPSGANSAALRTFAFALARRELWASICVRK